ncbi:MAG: Aldehyde Dehydrogenase [Gammaproteobacteria bacterium]|jgi:aldehyde dehydrogenase (NAD+)|nr:Aldehyde Dehydrogenase [Gammaproteobacteria bacterium]
MNHILKTLNILDINHGARTGHSNYQPTNYLDTLPSINPATEEVIALTQTASKTHFDEVIAQSVRTFDTWRQVPAPKRGELIRLLGDALRKNKDALGSLIAIEMGKIKQEGDGEVQEMIDMADFAVGQSRMLYGKTMHSERPRHRMYEQWHPLGVVGVITAFNFPMAVWAWNAFIAAICGNTVIWKPSSKTPLCAIAIQNICERVMAEAGYPGIFSLLITANNDLALNLVADQRLSLISFTGSVPVGRKVNEIVAHRLGKTLLELSGNNAVIIDETADLSLAIPAVLFGAIGTAGQRCTSIRRLFVHHSLLEKVTQSLKDAYSKVMIGNPLDSKVLMGPLIDQQAVEYYEKALQRIKQSGGEILYGGMALAQKGFFVMPTLATARADWEIVKIETFAPILYLIPFNHLDEAIAQQNNTPQGLSSAIFTRNLQHAEQFLSVIGSDCGIANVNIGTSGAEIGGAFGGEKETGGGRESGSDAWKAYMRRQTNTINWGEGLPLAQGIRFEI